MIPKKEFKVGDKVKIIKPDSIEMSPSSFVGEECIIIREDKAATNSWNSNYSVRCGIHTLYVVEGKGVDNSDYLFPIAKFDNKNQIDVVDFCLELLESKQEQLSCTCSNFDLTWNGCRCGVFQREKEDN